jgi:Tfp pilus assembly protein PilF
LDPDTDSGRIARENSAIAAINEGMRHLRAGRYVDAGRWFQNARQYDPNYPGSYDPLAQLAYNQGQGDMDRADVLWQKAIDLWSRRSVNGPTAQARAEAAKSLEQVQRNAATAWLNRGDLLRQVGRAAEAQQAWTRAMQYGAGTEIALSAQRRMGSDWGGGGY